MLIEFRVTNFRSFKETQTLSMVAGTLAEHLQTNTSSSPLKGFERFLRTAAIYGPNAAGKTNLLRALQFAQTIVLNSAAVTSPGHTPFSPFKFSAVTRSAPTEFQITFTQNQIRYEYGFAFGPRRIEKEWLIEYVHPRGRTMFERTYDERKDRYEWHFSSFLKGQRSVWRDSTRPDALFLSTAIQLNNTQLLPVFEWFQKRLIVVVGVTTLNPTLTLKLLDEPNGKERLLPFLREADLGITDLEVRREPIPSGAGFVPGTPILEQVAGSSTVNLIKVTFSHWSDDSKDQVLDLAEESSGTQVLFRSAGAWLNVFANGEVLLFDEIDTSLHPLLVRYLIQRFHSKQTNPNNAQLIFSTHNTSLLDRELFRRDQIWFVEKRRDGASHLYPLTDFKPRNDEVLERWYMRGRYGALPIIDEIRN
jgi:AAA15 family ATPase/GTPase